MTLPRTIAIDGPAGSGKSSVSYSLAQHLHYLFVDTGAFYRAVTLAALEAGQLDADDTTLVALSEQCDLDITPDQDADGRHYTILLNGRDVTWDIRGHAVDLNVSHISAIGGIREVLNRKYRQLAERGPVIMAGRDIGTVVLPHADLKIYLDASPEARAKRRYDQRVATGELADYEAILEAMRRRDAYDTERDVAPLSRALDAHYIDTDALDIESVIEVVRQMVLNWQPAATLR